MPNTLRHPGDDEIQDALDRRLPAPAQLAFEAHLAACVECRAKWETLGWAKAQAGRAARLEPPQDLAGRIAFALDQEEGRSGVIEVRRRPWRRGGPAPWVAGALAAALLVAVWFGRRPDMPQAVAQDYAALGSRALVLDVRTADLHDLEEHLAGARLPFPVRVLDLGMMRYRLVGGRVHHVGGRPSVLIVYEGADGHILLCEMYRGSLADLPPKGEPHEHGGISFRVFQRREVTLAFWPEGDVLCVLAGEGGSKTILPLAFAKAMKGARATTRPVR